MFLHAVLFPIDGTMQSHREQTCYEKENPKAKKIIDWQFSLISHFSLPQLKR